MLLKPPFVTLATDPPTHIVGWDERVYPCLFDKGHNPVDQDQFAKLPMELRDCTPVRMRRAKRVRLSDEEVKKRRPEGVQDILLCNPLCPGDLLQMSAVLREFHREHQGKYRTGIQCRFPQLFQNNPHVTPFEDLIQPARVDWEWNLACTYPQIEGHRHLNLLWRDHFCSQLEIPIFPMADVNGEIFLTEEEKEWPTDLLGPDHRSFVLVNAGIKSDRTVKAWGHSNYQAVVNQMHREIEFVQLGLTCEYNYHAPLQNATNLLDRTSLRDVARLVYWSTAVLSPISFLFHCSAAVPRENGRCRPCVVLAGAIEPLENHTYHGHIILSTIGSLNCCKTGACGRFLVPDASQKPDNPLAPVNDKICVDSVSAASGERIGRCMSLISTNLATAALRQAIINSI